MNQKFINFMNEFSGQKLAVAVSGGVDSVCLLCWLDEIGARPVALHVNHGLRANADTEAAYVRDLCAARGLECHIFQWRGEKPTTGLEAAARTARYKMMTDWCTANNVDALLVAHQADDQIETFLMNLGRGSGLSGLAAMRPVTMRDGVKIVRPLLGVYRAELKQYCAAHRIKYFADEMNDDEKYTRVRIRKNRHVMSEMLGISDDRILLATQNLGRIRDAIETNVSEMVASVVDARRAIFPNSFLFDQDDNIRLKFIGTLIQKIGGDNYQPRLNSLRHALDLLHGDCKFTLGHCTLRRLNNQILVVPEGEKTSFRTRHGKAKKQ